MSHLSCLGSAQVEGQGEKGGRGTQAAHSGPHPVPSTLLASPVPQARPGDPELVTLPNAPTFPKRPPCLQRAEPHSSWLAPYSLRRPFLSANPRVRTLPGAQPRARTVRGPCASVPGSPHGRAGRAQPEQVGARRGRETAAAGPGAPAGPSPPRVGGAHGGRPRGAPPLCRVLVPAGGAVRLRGRPPRSLPARGSPAPGCSDSWARRGCLSGPRPP